MSECGAHVRAIMLEARPSNSASSPSPDGPKNFLGEFFFPKTSSLLRKVYARRSRDVKGW